MSDIEIGSVWVSKLDSNRLVVVSRTMPENNALQYTRGTWRTTLSVSDFLSEFELIKNPCLDDCEAPRAVQILNEAVAIMAERGKSYDKSGGEAERSMPKIVAMFNALTGHELTPEQGWKFMCCLKLARSEQGEYREDNYLDGAAYMALAGEEAEAGSEAVDD